MCTNTNIYGKVKSERKAFTENRHDDLKSTSIMHNITTITITTIPSLKHQLITDLSQCSTYSFKS
jgi:hypothetical protein